MKQKLFFLFALISLTLCRPAENQQSSSEHDQFLPLFNGLDLSGWHTSGPVLTEVKDNILTVSNDQSGSEGLLLTDREYENFHLILDFLCPPPNNSGILIRYNENTDLDPSIAGYEFNIFNTVETRNPTGSIMNLARAYVPDTLNADDWNTLEIIAVADCLVSKINGIPLLLTHQRRAFRGSIGIQAHSGRVKHQIRLRNIRIKPLQETNHLDTQIEDLMRSSQRPMPVQLLNLKDLSNWEVMGDGTWRAEKEYLFAESNTDDFSFLGTRDVYHNFYLKLKFNVRKSQNSGVFIRVDPESPEMNIESGLEINIYDHNGFSYGWPTGSVVTKARAFMDLVDYEEWNTMEIFTMENHVCTYVNGIKSSEYYMDDSFNRPGRICLQIGKQVATEERGASTVKFKDVIIREF